MDRDAFKNIKDDPQKWYIEVCGTCGGQLGPGVGSRTSTGRCVDESHRDMGGVIMLVDALSPSLQIDINAAKIVQARFKKQYKNIADATYEN